MELLLRDASNPSPFIPCNLDTPAYISTESKHSKTQSLRTNVTPSHHELTFPGLSILYSQRNNLPPSQNHPTSHRLIQKPCLHPSIPGLDASYIGRFKPGALVSGFFVWGHSLYYGSERVTGFHQTIKRRRRKEGKGTKKMAGMECSVRCTAEPIGK